MLNMDQLSVKHKMIGAGLLILTVFVVVMLVSSGSDEESSSESSPALPSLEERMKPVNENQESMDTWCNAFGKSRKVDFDGTETNKLVYRFDKSPDSDDKAHGCYRKSALDYSEQDLGCYNKEGDLVACYGVFNGVSTDFFSNDDWTTAIKNRIKLQTGNPPKFGN